MIRLKIFELLKTGQLSTVHIIIGILLIQKSRSVQMKKKNIILLLYHKLPTQKLVTETIKHK